MNVPLESHCPPCVTVIIIGYPVVAGNRDLVFEAGPPVRWVSNPNVGFTILMRPFPHFFLEVDCRLMVAEKRANSCTLETCGREDRGG